MPQCRQQHQRRVVQGRPPLNTGAALEWNIILAN